MRRVVVSTCGTSLMTNAAEPGLRQSLLKSSNSQRHEIDSGELPELLAHIVRRRDELLAAPRGDAVRKLSAELNGILGLYGDAWRPSDTAQDLHFLVHSDTFLGEQSAELVRCWLEAAGVNATPVRVPDLNTAEAESFRSAMSWLIRWCTESLPPLRDAGFQITFSLVGGFKALQGFMQAVGMFLADECTYIFESGGELLRIPRLPVRLDEEGAIGAGLPVFRRLDAWGQVPSHECQGVPEVMLFEMGDQCCLSPWGELMWAQCKAQLLGAGLLEPISARVRWSDRFARTALDAPLMARLNAQLGMLCRCVDSGGAKMGHNPKALDFKEMATPLGSSTHECDAFGGGDSRRLYGHYEGDVYVVDQLGAHR